MNEYVGNIIYPRFMNKRAVLPHKHDKLLEITNLTLGHPIMSKIDKNIKSLISLNINTLMNYPPALIDPSLKYSLIPINDKLKTAGSITSKCIRLALQTKTKISCKMISDPDEDLITNLGYLISKLTNVRSKTTMLRAIHGDIYCGTRLKKFGMTDSELCPRCNIPETIAHQLMECSYVTKIWEITSKITGIKVTNLNQILGHDPRHDKITLTLYAEIIRLLLAIERPTIEPLKLVTASVRRLSIVERGITKFQIGNMLETIKNFTCN